MSEDLSNPLHKSETDKSTLLKPSLYGGRFTRMQYFLYLLAGIIVVEILSFLIRGVIILNPAMSLIAFLLLLFLLLLINILSGIFYFMPIGVKRAHDIGLKGNFVIVVWLGTTIVGWLAPISVFFWGFEAWPVLPLMTLGPNLVYGCILLFSDSEEGTNAYGSSTKYPDTIA